METYLYMKEKYGGENSRVLRMEKELGLDGHRVTSEIKDSDEETRTIVKEGLAYTSSSSSHEDEEDEDKLSMTGMNDIEQEIIKDSNEVAKNAEKHRELDDNTKKNKEKDRKVKIDTKNEKANAILDGFLASRVTKVADAKREGDTSKLKLYTRELKDATTAIDALVAEENGDLDDTDSKTATGKNTKEEEDDDNDDDTNKVLSSVLPFALTTGTLFVLVLVLIMNGTFSCEAATKKKEQQHQQTTRTQTIP